MKHKISLTENVLQMLTVQVLSRQNKNVYLLNAFFSEYSLSHNVLVMPQAGQIHRIIDAQLIMT